MKKLLMTIALMPLLAMAAEERMLCHYTVVTGRVGQALLNPDTGAPYVDIDFCDLDSCDAEMRFGEETAEVVSKPDWLTYDKSVSLRPSVDMPDYDPSRTWWYQPNDRYHPFAGTPTSVGEFAIEIRVSWNDGCVLTQKVKVVVLEAAPKFYYADNGDGTIVVGTAHGGACETIEDGKTGFLVPPGDIDALAARLDAILDMPTEKRNEMKTAAIRSVTENFSVTSTCAKTVALYREILSSRRM